MQYCQKYCYFLITLLEITLVMFEQSWYSKTCKSETERNSVTESGRIMMRPES